MAYAVKIDENIHFDSDSKARQLGLNISGRNSMNWSTDYDSSNIDEVLIEFSDLIFGKGFVPIYPLFFTTGEMSDQKKSLGGNDLPYDSSPPPRAQIVGAKPVHEALAGLAQRVEPKQLAAQCSPVEILHPQYAYWNYPRSVPKFWSFENEMVSILQNGSIKKLICREGSNEKLKVGDTVLINYYMYVEGFEYCVDSNKRKQKPHSLMLGQQNGFPVLELGTLSMKVNEVAAFLAQPEHAYGKMGMGVWIPANARVLCIIEVLRRLASPSDSCSILNMVSAERRLLSFREIFSFCKERKMDADGDIRKGKIKCGLRKYFEVATCMEDASAKHEQQDEDKTCLLYDTYESIWRVSFTESKFSTAAQFARKSTELPIPEEKKGLDYFRLAKALYSDKRSPEAKPFIDSASKLLQGSQYYKHVLELQNMVKSVTTSN